MNKNQKESVKEFVERWNKESISEKSESQTFWLSLLRDVFGVEKPEDYIKFEEPVQLGHKSFIDGIIYATHVMIEQKSSDKDLNEKIKQSDGTFLTPYQQAQRYSSALPYSKRPRWTIACNFKEFHIYDMENPQAKPEVILLENLETEYYRLNFLIDKTSESVKRELEVSIKAGEIVGKLYDALHKQYINPDSEESLKSLNKLCVRLVFCLYAESAGIFGKRNMFREYLQTFREKNIRRALIDLFEVLNTPNESRDPYMEDDLATFPYVNGGLFDEDNIEIPKLTTEIIDLLIHQASGEFDWSGISPTIFGAVFESTLNPITRRSGGMHYTSIENIHKLIDPLFLDDLHNEFSSIKAVKTTKTRQTKLKDFQDKLASLKFLDPACGSGNFLTETYLSLRRLENEVLKELIGAQITLGELNNPIKVSISQFYGIEVNDFAVTVAKTALWIAESQMMAETAAIVHRDLDFLPLKTYTNIEEGNALRIDWHKVAPNVDYIMGNPPFVGYKMLTDSQKNDLVNIISDLRSNDYVTGWYFKTADFIQNTKIKCAFVSTNSIIQGSAIQNFWKLLATKYTVNIIFAWKPFIWQSESNEKAHVHCVIIGFSFSDFPNKIIFADKNDFKIVNKINFNLFEGENVILTRRGKPLSKIAPEMTKGAQLIDGGGFMLNSEEEKNLFLKKYPESEPYIFRYYNAKDFINGTSPKYCLYLKNCPPNVVKNCKGIRDKVQQVYDYRINSNARTTKILAETPTLFFQSQVPSQKNIVIPVVSSERRKYIPIGFMSAKNVYTNALFYIDGANLFHFGILTSSIHMIWTKTFCGRLESRIRYSNDIIYNNFPFPEKNFDKISATAEKILQVRKNYPDASLADLYDPTLMPKDLRDAHKKNDLEVMEAYGFDSDMTEAEIVAELMKMYSTIVER